MSTPNVYVGADPGFSSGGLVAIDGAGNVLMVTRLSKTTPHDMAMGLNDLRGHGNIVASMEVVGAMPKQGVSSMFKFGRGLGRMEMALIAVGARVDEVTPATWMRPYTKGKKMPKTQRKQLLRGEAQRLFPSESIVLEIADAYLLAEHARTLGKWARAPLVA